jgi:hypothetical protein
MVGNNPGPTRRCVTPRARPQEIAAGGKGPILPERL